MVEETISDKSPFQSRYLEVLGSKLHYIEKGKGDPVLFIHGNPTSSYIWRNIIPHMSKDSRCIAVDLIGFGKSDKPDIDYGFNDTYKYLEKFIEKLELKNVTIVVQDWGSGLGFHYANTHKHNITGIAFMEAMYKQTDFKKLSAANKIIMKLIQTYPTNYLMFGVMNMFVKTFIPEWVNRKLTKTEIETYNKPFKKLKDRKPIWVFPKDVPTNGKPKHTAKIVNSYHKWLTQTNIPKICFYGTPGVLIPIDQIDEIKQTFPNTTFVNVGKSSHFIQEDHPHLIGKELNKWYKNI